MKHDPFDLCATGMTMSERAWRIAFLVACMSVLIADLFIWRP